MAADNRTVKLAKRTAEEAGKKCKNKKEVDKDYI